MVPSDGVDGHFGLGVFKSLEQAPCVLINLDGFCNGIMCHESRLKLFPHAQKKSLNFWSPCCCIFIFILPTRTCHEKKIQEEMI